MIAIKVLFVLWMILGFNCRSTDRKIRLCRQAGEILDNGSFTPLNEIKRKYVCRSDFVSNIPDLEKLIFMCKFERKSDSYEWRAKLTRVDYLYLRNVTCEQKTKCSDPPLPRNMTREITTRYLIPISSSSDREAGNDFYTGDTLKYSCKSGFSLLSDLETSSFINGDDLSDYYYNDDKPPQLATTSAPVTVSVLNDITCDAEGFWNGFPDSQLYFGECQAIQCNASVFADISDGNISNFKETYEFLDEMKLECKDGYRHKGGVKSALCMTPSSFSNLFLTGFGCERIKCIELESPGNGYLKVDHNYVNGTVNYECESGYDLIGYPVWRCQSNGEWDHDCVKCAHKDAYCLPPCLPPGAITKTSSGRYQMGDVLEFTCKYGKYYGGSTNRTCMKNRYWSGTPIDCTGTSLVDLRVGIKLVRAMKQILQNRTKSDTPISKTINVWNRKGVDMYLLVDISKVETPETMNKTLSLVYALLPELGIHDGDTGTRLALTFFGTKPYTMFEQHIKSDDGVEGPFKSYEDVIKELEHYNNKTVLHDIKQKTEDGTNITAALSYTYEQIKTKLEGPTHRKSQQVLIIISDGRLTTTDDTTKLAKNLTKHFLVERYSIAIGDLTDTKSIETMKNLSSDIKNGQHFFKISNEESKFKQVMSSMINKDFLNVSCGLTEQTLTGITNASENREVNAKKNAWPWMADLRTLNSHECGGSVIKDQWILTAAHCFNQKHITKVHLGKKAVNGTDGYDEYNISTIHTHNNYTHNTYQYDIALVRLSQKINWTLELLPVCLGDKTIQNVVNYTKLFIKTHGVVTGWGKKSADTLKQMQMEVKSSKECLENLTPKEKANINTSLMFCAGGNGTVDGRIQFIDTCEGDSGGPFVVQHPADERKYIQIGIVSFGFGCKQEGKYGFYTKLTKELLDWINDTIEKVEKKEWCETDKPYTKYQNEDGSELTSGIPSGKDVWISCENGYAFYNDRGQLMPSPQKRRCVQRQIKDAPTCKEGTCEKPKEVQHAVLRDKYANKEKFNEGDIVEYDCELGYTIEGITRERWCNNSKWTDVRFTCNQITCPWVPHPDNGRHLDTTYAVGDVMKFECNIGYKLKGRDEILCRKNGQWSPPQGPNCDPILCPTLPQIQHGSIFQDTSDGLANNYESVAEYTCDRDYYLNGNTQLKTVRRTCQSGGKWSGNEPICEVLKCNLIDDFYGGSVEYIGRRDLYSQAFYSCDENYSMIPGNVQHSTCENNLRWEPPPPKCFKKADRYVPNVGYLRGWKRGKVSHGESYKICCNKGFEVERDDNVPVNKEECTNIRNNNGTLEPSVACVEEWCEPDRRHTEYKHEDDSEFTSRIPSDEMVWMRCKKGYAFYDNRNQPLPSPQKRRCVQGKIQNAPTCIEAKSSLVGYPYRQFTLYRDSKRNILDRKRYIEPNERIEVFCSDGYELYVEFNRLYLDEFFTTSRYGEFDKEKNKFPVCLERRCVFEPSKVQGACFVTDDERNCKREELKILSGSSAKIKCEKGYTFFVLGKEVRGQQEIACDKGSYPEFRCTAKTIDERCLTIDNGNVQKSKNYYVVSCDKGFSLDIFAPEEKRSNCIDGILKSIVGGQEPTCKADPCKVPYDYDALLSISDRSYVSLSGGSVVEVGDSVFFNCSKAVDDMHEPVNRRFKCINGEWIEDERDKSWKFGNNGTFPICRKTICEPECENGGVCLRDDECKCKHFTSGKHCEDVLCDDKCKANNGECVGPGKCRCPQGKFGTNCELISCRPPEIENMAKLNPSRTHYAIGETIRDLTCNHGHFLSSDKGMTCQNNGTWSDVITCVKGIYYLIRAKTGTRTGAGTNANVFITLSGSGGSTRRINFGGRFESGDVDEIREFAKDIRPIDKVHIGHDGGIILPAWDVEYISIYVEHMEEFYVFRNNRRQWVEKDNDLTLHREGNKTCINSFDKGHLWYLDWQGLSFIRFGRAGKMSLRTCKQSCVNWKDEATQMQCVSVYYDHFHKACSGFTFDNHFYPVERNRWNGRVYLRTCKHYDLVKRKLIDQV